MSHRWSRCGQDALKLKRGEHVGQFGVLVVIKFGRIKGRKTGRQYNCADLEVFVLQFLVKIDSTGGAYFLTGPAFAFLDKDTAVAVNAIFQWNGLGVFDIG